MLVLEVNGCIDSCLWTKKPVRNLEDLAGLMIRTPGGMQTNCLKALGAEPAFMPLDQVHEVANYATLETFGCVGEGLFMNQDSWNRTPEEVERWYSRFQNASRQWAEDMEIMGLPGKEAIKIFNEACQERGIRCVVFPEDWR